MSRFQNACDDARITERQGRKIVNYYLKRFAAIHHTVYDMGRSPDAELVEMHFMFKRRHGRNFQSFVLAEMAGYHNDLLFRRAVARKLPPASPFIRPRRQLGDLLRRR